MEEFRRSVRPLAKADPVRVEGPPGKESVLPEDAELPPQL